VDIEMRRCTLRSRCNTNLILLTYCLSHARLA